MSLPGKNNQNGKILSSVISGDNAKTEALIQKYVSMVEIISGKYTGFPLEYDDIFQEGMIGLLAAIKTYNPDKGASFSTYASTCVNNSIQTALRKFNRQKDIPTQNLTEYSEENITLPNGTLSAEEHYIAAESVSLLVEFLKDNLSEYENEVLRLHIVGCSYSEIASKLCKTPKSVDNALQRVKKKLSAKNKTGKIL